MTPSPDAQATPLVIDTHADTPQRFVDEGWDFTGPLTSSFSTGMLSLQTARAGRLAAEFFAIWAEPAEWRGRFAHRTLSLIDGVLEQVRKAPAQLALCTSPADILAARDAGKFAVLMGIEGGHSIENSLALLRLYHRLGVRYMTLTWSNSNEWADSSGDLDDPNVPHHNGLSAFGHTVIAEMNRLGLMIDVSHASDKTLADVLASSHAPILASHSSARALTDSARNLTDPQLRAIARAGGVVMANFFPAFIDERWRREWAAQKEERRQAHESLLRTYRERAEPVPYAVSNQIDRDHAAKLAPAPLASLIDHIDHMVKVAGVDHVGIGSDFDGIPAAPLGLETAAGLPLISEALRARGYSPEDLNKILGGNLMRVFQAVQEAGDQNTGDRKTAE